MKDLVVPKHSAELNILIVVIKIKRRSNLLNYTRLFIQVTRPLIKLLEQGWLDNPKHKSMSTQHFFFWVKDGFPT